MDIPNKLIYGINPPPLTHPNARKLKMKDPRRVKRYNDRLHEECERAHMYHRMDTLHHNATDSLTKFQQQEYEQLDMELCKMIETVDQKCRKLCVGSVAWPPTYKRVNLVLEYWRMRKAYHLGLHKNIRQLIVLQNKLQIKYNKKLSLPQTINNIRETAK